MSETKDLTSQAEFKKLLRNATIPILFAVVIVTIEIIETIFGLNFIFLANRPRTLEGLDGILTMPLIHSDYGHVSSNASSILVLGTFLYYFYNKVADRTLLIIWVLSGIFVWLIARTSNHLGASGVVYGLAAFLFFSGIFRKDIKSAALALVVVTFYGGLLWGMYPGLQGISWEGHLGGFLAGLICAFYFKEVDKPEKHPYETEVIDKTEKEYWKNFVD